ncbi:MAG TPA: response regulator [Blastocatellia bacterium]|nr:response regulator [Blastocatellia bacterium]
MTPKSILIVEDNCDSRELLAALLKMEGFSILTAEDGHTGLKTAKAERPDAIITDLHMPEGDGIRMIQELRQQPDLSGIPIIAVTAYGDWNATLAANAGADDTIQKPINIEMLVEKMRSLLRMPE